MSPLDRFLASVAAIRREIDALPEAAVREILADLQAARRQVVAAIATTEPASFTAHRLAGLEAAIDDVMARFVEKYGAALAPAQAVLFEAGAHLVATPLQHAGVSLATPVLSRRLLETAQHYQAGLITHASDETVAAISRTLRLGLLRGQSVPEVAAAVQGSLAAPGPFGALAARAEAITRTELGRIQAIATQATLTDAQRAVPDLQKQWRHSRNAGKWARTGHIAADGQVRDVDQPFDVAPKVGTPVEQLMYPRDPHASAASVVHCGCVSLPYRAAWASALDAAAAENRKFLEQRHRRAA